jgi:hypothetical protein
VKISAEQCFFNYLIYANLYLSLRSTRSSRRQYVSLSLFSRRRRELMSSNQSFQSVYTMASSSHPLLNETNVESQPHSPPDSRIEAFNRRVEELKLIMNNDPIPNFDINTIRPAVPEVKIDVSQRVEELQKYLRENTYPTQQKNIMAAIEMYNRKELPKPGTNAVWIQDGKLTALTVDCLLRAEPVWTEVRLRQQARIYLIHALGSIFSVNAGTVYHIWCHRMPRPPRQGC